VDGLGLWGRGCGRGTWGRLQRFLHGLGLCLPLERIELDFFGLDFSPKRPGTGGLVEAALQLPPGLASRDVVLASVSIHGVPAMPAPVDHADTNADGVDELILYFDAELLFETLPRSSIVEIVITGEVLDRALFRGSTVVRGVSEIGR
jgi:hypothetical protein